MENQINYPMRSRSPRRHYLNSQIVEESERIDVVHLQVRTIVQYRMGGIEVYWTVNVDNKAVCVAHLLAVDCILCFTVGHVLREVNFD
jgi:hypothetical protein